MGIFGRVRVYTTSNPWVEGPFTNALTSGVYLPTSWVASFPGSEIISVLAHEFGHITRRKRLITELGLAVTFAYAFALNHFTEFVLSTNLLLLVSEAAQTAMALILVSFVSWRAEYRADIDGASMTGPEGLISVFELLRTKFSKDDGSETHPPLSKRIQRIEALL